MTIEKLRRIRTFETLSDRGAHCLTEGATERPYSSGSVIWRQGTRATVLHVLLAGTARAVCSRAGRETIVHRARAGDTLGEIPLFDGGLYPASLVAESPVRVLLLKRESVMTAMQVDVGLAATFLRSLGHRVRDLAERLETRMAESVRTRLARHLLVRAETSTRGDFDLGMTQGCLAQDLGTVREVVARHLGELVRCEVLERTGRSRFRIADRVSLEAMAAEA
ncbi:MAG TPA: Crp/Fnr family transcriptional regulator [Longimicrobiales bacterium]|nr:Crp/Fnr family transcriptional regulator [Longimicrobiales bacterium]